ncbi:MAG: complex I subunit 5 family protein [Marinobacter sp.]|nr:complex I subunit 5 family protein [Marinobacter sp.]
MSALIWGAVLLPLLLPLLVVLQLPARGLRLVLPWLPVPALVLALSYEAPWALHLPYLLLGASWGLDDVRQLMLLAASLLWLCAGLYASAYIRAEGLRRYSALWGLTLAGNLGLILSLDLASFYTFFALMTFAGYGLVIHDRTKEALWAGKVYLVMAIVGEMAVLSGLLLASHQAGSLQLASLPEAVAGAENGLWIFALLLVGFGVKAGLPLLHFWLPLAHPVAPTPASAVLSGAMIKGGLLGWVLVLPLGLPGYTGLGQALVVLGALGSLGGAALGLLQQRPKTVLAYSSISQMGLMTLLVGSAIAAPHQASLIVPVIALYALHHGLAKGALFLAVGLKWPDSGWPRWLGWGLVMLPGLALAGLPFTSGAAAKTAMKGVLQPDQLGFGLAHLLPALMAAGAMATTLLILRYLVCLRDTITTGYNTGAILAGWGGLTFISLLLFWWLPWPQVGELASLARLGSLKDAWGLTWPLLAAGAVAWPWLRRLRSGPQPGSHTP